MHSSSSLLESSTILIVDNSTFNLMLLTRILECQGATVITASTGESALYKAEQAFPDLILLDINLPDLDGYKICQVLKQEPILASIPVVFISGLKNTASKIKAFDVGGQDYITKPFHPQEVIVRVKQQLTNQELQKQLKNEIQQRKKSEQALIQQSEELEQAKNSAEQANRAKSEFLANMSHELRTPLNAILGFSQVIEQTGELTQEQQDYLAIIRRCGHHLLQLINGVLDMVKIESGQITLSEKTCDLYQILRTLETIFKLKVRDKNITMEFQFDSYTPQYIDMDETKLRQILLNLLDNAVKFTETGHVVLRSSTQPIQNSQVDQPHWVGPKMVWLQFEVEDTGPGISHDELDLLFQAFVQTDSGKRYNGGTGLGLAISKEFASLMNGDITVESSVGEGSIFRLRIPAKLGTSPDNTSSNILPKTTFIEREKTFIAPKNKDGMLMNVAIKHMPQRWKQDLKRAAITGSDSKMMSLVSEIPNSFHELATLLTHWINDFKFEKIISLIEKSES